MDWNWAIIFCLLDTELVLPHFIRWKKKPCTYAQANSNWKLLLALSKLSVKLSENCTATLQSSHQNTFGLTVNKMSGRSFPKQNVPSKISNAGFAVFPMWGSKPKQQCQVTTPGTTFPTLCERCAGSLTSPANYVILKMQQTGPTVFRPYPRRLQI